MRHRDHRDPQALGQQADRLEHLPNFRILMAVGLPAEVRADRINPDHRTIAYLADFGLEEIKVGLQIENSRRPLCPPCERR